MSLGWIKLHRDLKEKPIWKSSTPEQKTILVTLLMMANHKENEWEWRGKPFKAKPGEFVTSIKSITEECGKGISSQNVRTALKRFENYGFLTKESTKVSTLINVVNWGVYQELENKTNTVTNKQLTNDSQTANKQLTTNKNVRTKECNKDNNNINNSDLNFKDFWEQNGFGMMLPVELEKLLAWVDDFAGNREIVMKALEVTSEQGANKRNYAYVNKILRNWEERGFKTVADVNAAEEERRKQNEQKYNKPTYGKYNKNQKQEVLPDWLDKTEKQPENKKTESESSGDLEKKVAEIKAKLAERDEVQT
ncbi:TPA_asm: DNA replication protein DnaD [Listeria monocytogenes]|uniref:DnaD domain-containing protein n=1 Tax=Listeria monocytogenes TaxID=1639 RepID=UPI000845C6A5|nr:DnaD domain-containing protein [Listeria monocytogenes]EED2601859.1 DnaD domain-containing protein [Listeria monocytogenes]EFR1215258.1 DnaD domain-containing protein [Listeria monocytogenes]EGS4874431.1 DnaD domain-containing protein [Listeria monocytogenes]EMC1959541.1 DnaD domain-containing protein [Listeria monocytogenes]NVW42230.1 DnaD domain-containing protein [Listeria monocytogenes]